LSASTSPVMPGTQFLNITSAGTDKGSAVRALAAEYGLMLEQLMFVGDGLNDIPALRLVGLPVAMANAAPEVREVAVRTVGDVDDDGLVEALDQAIALAATAGPSSSDVTSAAG